MSFEDRANLKSVNLMRRVVSIARLNEMAGLPEKRMKFVECD